MAGGSASALPPATSEEALRGAGGGEAEAAADGSLQVDARARRVLDTPPSGTLDVSAELDCLSPPPQGQGQALPEAWVCGLKRSQVEDFMKAVTINNN